MRALNAVVAFSITVTCMLTCTCRSYSPYTPARLDAPAISEPRVSEARLFGTWRETIRLSWTPPPAADPMDIRSYTLIRKTDNDSTFDIFIRSQGIPSTIDTFFDDTRSIGFPDDTYLLVMYRIFAVDILGRSGDTSAACSLYLARQPVMDSIDPARSIFKWRSQFIQGSVSTWLKLWNADRSVLYAGSAQEQFGSWDYPLFFTERLPDSLTPMPKGKWFFAVYLHAMGIERQSLKVDSLNVVD